MLRWTRFLDILKEMDVDRMISYYTKWRGKLLEAYEGSYELGDISRDIVIVGMGGSGIAGYIFKDIVGERVGRYRIHVFNDSRLYGVDIKRSTLVLISHSGNTGEVLDVASNYGDMAKNVAVITTDGKLSNLAEERGWHLNIIDSAPLPRLGLPQLLGSLLKTLSRVARDINVKRVGDRMERLIRRNMANRRECDAYRTAMEIHGGIPAIYYPTRYVSVAIRFKAMLNENSKQPSYIYGYPEIFHNEIEIYTYTSGIPIHPYIFDDGSIYPKILKSFLHEKGIPYSSWRVDMYRDKASNILASIAFHDLVSLYLAGLKRVNAYKTPSIARYKELMREWHL